MELVILVTALIAAVVYSVILWRCKPDEFIPWLSGLLATLISIFLGFMVALILFKYTGDQEDAASRARLLRLLQTELSYTLDKLSNAELLNITLKQSTQSVQVTYLQPLIIEQAAMSGLFGEVTTKNLLILALSMRMHNVKIQYLLNSIIGKSDEAVRHASKSLKKSRQTIMDDIKIIVKNLHIDLSPSPDAKRRLSPTTE